MEKEKDNNIDGKGDVQKLTPQQKKTILEWAKYIGVSVLKAIACKLFGLKCASVIVIALSVVGCVQYPEVYVSEPWEGHYMTTNDFYKATKDINLGKNQSIWVLSNKSLLKVIENSQKGK